MTSPLRICALIAARNERAYLQTLLPLLAAQDIDVAILDHGSSDGSASLYEEFRGQPVIRVEHLPDTGVFSLSAQLQAKQQLAESLPHSWLVHHDADEWLHHRIGVGTLRDCIESAAEEGANAVNFEEFVFLPHPEQTNTDNPIANNLHYYYFLKESNRLNRAFHRSLNGSNGISGGHRISSPDLKMASITHVLRHYIARSQEHIVEKYGTRRFCPEELAAGWHRKRQGIPADNLRIPLHSPNLRQLPHHQHPELNRSHPVNEHYWWWSPEERQPLTSAAITP